jgi:hypothetical protein
VDDRIRTSDADRERVTARLRDHFAEGRLTRDELDERITAALNARTFGDLRRVLADLPEPRPVAPQRGPLVAAPRPYLALRRGPRLFPLLAIAVLALLLVHGAGPVAIFLYVVLSMITAIFVLTTIAAIAAAAFFRQARRHWYAGQFDRHAWNRQAWTWPRG